jgi:hypothetical protein
MLIHPAEPNDGSARIRSRVWRLLQLALFLFLVALGCLSPWEFKSNAPSMDWLMLIGVLSAVIAALSVVAVYLYRRCKVALLVDDDPPVLWGTDRHRGAKLDHEAPPVHIAPPNNCMQRWAS